VNDILFAVALGEGFITGMYECKKQIVNGEVFSIAVPAIEIAIYRPLDRMYTARIGGI
jgi:hypothetical protein